MRKFEKAERWQELSMIFARKATTFPITRHADGAEPMWSIGYRLAEAMYRMILCHGAVPRRFRIGRPAQTNRNLHE